jgi:putative peptidoglycan lipid II flippase
MAGFAKSTALITAFTAAGLCLGFLSNLVIAAGFGVGEDMDVYLAATTLPSLITVILTTSLAAAFLPVFAERREQDVAEGWKVAAAVMNLTALGSLGLCLAGMLFADPLARLLAPGFTPAQAGATASLMRWLLPGVVLAAVNQLFSSMYYAQGRFLAPMLIRVTAPLFTILSVLWLAPDLSVGSLVAATLAANALQTAVLLAGLAGTTGARYSLELGGKLPAVRKIVRLMLPLMAGMCFYKLGPVFERWLASEMGAGSISILGYAKRLTSVLQPVLISGISISGFALMASHVSKNDGDGMRAVLTKSCNALFFISVPLAILLCGFGKPIIALLFERGAFTPQDTLETYRVFAVHVLVLPATAAGTMVGQAFYAFRDTRIPTLIGVLEILLFVVISLALMPRLGLVALPAGFNIAYYLTTILISALLSRKVGFSVPVLFLGPLSKSLAAAGAALALGLLLRAFSPSHAWAMLCLAASFAAYFLIQKFAFKCREAETLLALLPRWPGIRKRP